MNLRLISNLFLKNTIGRQSIKRQSELLDIYDRDKAITNDISGLSRTRSDNIQDFDSFNFLDRFGTLLSVGRAKDNAALPKMEGQGKDTPLLDLAGTFQL